MNDENYKIYFLTICFNRLCLDRLIYFCRSADFKLKRNKVQSRKFSFAVMENFDTEFVASLLNEFYRICTLIKGTSRLGT